jgi:predicted transcriptional regulator
MQRLTVSEAAKTLGVSAQAVHGRIKRETIEHEVGDDGKLYVYIPDSDVDNSFNNTVVNDYITALKSEIESLKADREVWQEEAKRKDTIIAQMTQTLQTTINRIPELEAPLEPAEGTVSQLTEESGGVVPPEHENRSWWRRIFAP